nr:MAG TPA: hypothetical protein [Caudoviricetes sp.]
MLMLSSLKLIIAIRCALKMCTRVLLLMMALSMIVLLRLSRHFQRLLRLC